MKIILPLIALILPLTPIFSLSVFGQQITGMSVIPENPTSLDSIKVVIQGNVPNPCIHFASGIYPSIGDSLGIILYDSTCPPPDPSLCPAVVTDFSLEVQIGQLQAGSYLLKVLIFRRWGDWVFCPFPHFYRPFCKTAVWQDSSGYHIHDCCWIGDCPVDTALFSFTVTQSSSILGGQDELASGFELFQNYPNPFNPTTDIEFLLSQSGQAKIEIFNISGQKVRTLVDQHLEAGHKVINWDGRDDSGKDVSSGIYFYRIETSEFSQTRKMVLLR